MSSAGEVTALIKRAPDGSKEYPSDVQYDGAVLWDFDVDRADVKPVHVGFIEGTFTSFLDRLANDGKTTDIQLFVTGNCSRTGSWEHNQVLSLHRAGNVASFFHGSHYTTCPFSVVVSGVGKMFSELYPSPWPEFPYDRNVTLGVNRLIAASTPPPKQRDTKEFWIRARFNKTGGGGIATVINMEFDILDVEREMYTQYKFRSVNLGYSPPWEHSPWWRGVGVWNTFSDDVGVLSCDFAGPASWWPGVGKPGHGVGDNLRFSTRGSAGTHDIFPFTITPGPYEISLGISFPVTGNMSPIGGEMPMKHWKGTAK